MKSTLRIALVGLGDIAQKAYLPIVANHANIEPILVTRKQDVLQQLVETYRIKERYASIDSVLLAKPDGVMIHSATPSHFELVKACLKAGIATFVDKPLSLEIDECRELVGLARAQQTPLVLGMNRRFAPLIAELNKDQLIHVRWQKNRNKLMENAKQTIFNDFIHVVDGLCYLAQVTQLEQIDNLVVDAYMRDGKLCNIAIRFKCRGKLFEGSMNRYAGTTEEHIEVFGQNEKIYVNSLTQGTKFTDGNMQTLGFSDWHSYLYTRGFTSLVSYWCNVVQQNIQDDNQLDLMLVSHEVCQQILQKIK